MCHGWLWSRNWQRAPHYEGWSGQHMSPPINRALQFATDHPLTWKMINQTLRYHWLINFGLMKHCASKSRSSAFANPGLSHRVLEMFRGRGKQWPWLRNRLIGDIYHIQGLPFRPIAFFWYSTSILLCHSMARLIIQTQGGSGNSVTYSWFQPTASERAGSNLVTTNSINLGIICR